MKKIDSEPIYNDKCIRTEVNSHNDKINTDFQNNGILKDGTCCICFPIILINSVSDMDKKYYPQGVLEECKYLVKKKRKIIRDFIEIMIQ